MVASPVESSVEKRVRVNRCMTNHKWNGGKEKVRVRQVRVIGTKEKVRVIGTKVMARAIGTKANGARVKVRTRRETGHGTEARFFNVDMLVG